MISEFFLGIFGWIVTALADLMGPWTPPAELVEASTRVNDLLASMAGLGAWVNWPVLIGCVAVSVGVWAVVVGIKLVRAIVAHVPMVGGAGD